VRTHDPAWYLAQVGPGEYAWIWRHDWRLVSRDELNAWVCAEADTWGAAAPRAREYLADAGTPPRRKRESPPIADWNTARHER
jgi:hypothetical protein